MVVLRGSQSRLSEALQSALKSTGFTINTVRQKSGRVVFEVPLPADWRVIRWRGQAFVLDTRGLPWIHLELSTQSKDGGVTVHHVKRLEGVLVGARNFWVSGSESSNAWSSMVTLRLYASWRGPGAAFRGSPCKFVRSANRRNEGNARLEAEMSCLHELWKWLIDQDPHSLGE